MPPPTPPLRQSYINSLRCSSGFCIKNWVCTRSMPPPTPPPRAKLHQLLALFQRFPSSWGAFRAAALNPSDPHWVLAGSLLHSLVSEELGVIAEGSLLNKVFPSKKEYHNQLRLGLQCWTKRNGLPSMPQSDISDLCQKLWTEHSKQVTCHITKSSISQFQKTFEGAIFHCEDNFKQSSSLRIYCPCLYYQSIEQTFQDPFSNRYPKTQLPLSHHLLRPSNANTASRTTGQLAMDDNYRLDISWQNERKTSGVADPSFLLWTLRFVLCSTSWLDLFSS